MDSSNKKTLSFWSILEEIKERQAKATLQFREQKKLDSQKVKDAAAKVSQLSNDVEKLTTFNHELIAGLDKHATTLEERFDAIADNAKMVDSRIIELSSRTSSLEEGTCLADEVYQDVCLTSE